jgi:hypothetical protein
MFSFFYRSFSYIFSLLSVTSEITLLSVKLCIPPPLQIPEWPIRSTQLLGKHVQVATNMRVGRIFSIRCESYPKESRPSVLPRTFLLSVSLYICRSIVLHFCFPFSFTYSFSSPQYSGFCIYHLILKCKCQMLPTGIMHLSRMSSETYTELCGTVLSLSKLYYTVPWHCSLSISTFGWISQCLKCLIRQNTDTLFLIICQTESCSFFLVFTPQRP